MLIRNILLIALSLGIVSCGGGGSVRVVGHSSSGANTSSTSGSAVSFGARILNGSEADSLASPQMVEVVAIAADMSVSRCSGAVIGADAVLTAGHCVAFGPTQVVVQNELVSALADSFTLAPAYREEASVRAIFADVAVVHVRGLNLPALSIIASHPVEAETSILTYGFGLDENGEFGMLKAGESKLAVVTPNHLFSVAYDGSGTNPCNGDSGGPAVQSFTTDTGEVVYGIVGVVSSGTEEACAKGDSTLYANLQNAELIQFLLSEVPDVTFR